jgi:hypothetical protein
MEGIAQTAPESAARSTLNGRKGLGAATLPEGSRSTAGGAGPGLAVGCDLTAVLSAMPVNPAPLGAALRCPCPTTALTPPPTEVPGACQFGFV